MKTTNEEIKQDEEGEEEDEQNVFDFAPKERKKFVPYALPEIYTYF